MNPLLQRPERRRVTKVDLVSRPGLAVFVRALTGAELSDLYDKVNASEKRGVIRAAQLEATVCDANGDATLKEGEGFALLDALDGIDVDLLIRTGDKLNILSSDAIEAERKN